jgi:hypothetical protein
VLSPASAVDASWISFEHHSSNFAEPGPFLNIETSLYRAPKTPQVLTISFTISSFSSGFSRACVTNVKSSTPVIAQAFDLVST